MKCEGQKESYRSRGWNAMRPDTAVTWRSCSCCLDSQAWGAGLTTWTLSMPIVSLHLTLSPVSLFNHFPLKRWNSKLLENHFWILSLTRMIFYALLMLARQLERFALTSFEKNSASFVLSPLRSKIHDSFGPQQLFYLIILFSLPILLMCLSKNFSMGFICKNTFLLISIWSHQWF